jgi:hypothetical protein
MRILAFSDIHGRIQKVEQIAARELPFDAIIVAGDLTTYGTRGQAETALRQLQSFGKPVFAVAGNMDPPDLENTFSSFGVSINARGVIMGDVGIFGVSASPYSPLHTPYEISEEEISQRAEAGWMDVRSSRWKIFVPHAPPIDTMVDIVASGKHVGSRSVRKFIERYQPHVTVCGHIHEARGQDRIGSTQIINCGPAGEGYFGRITLTHETVLESCDQSDSM